MKEARSGTRSYLSILNEMIALWIKDSIKADRSGEMGKCILEAILGS